MKIVDVRATTVTVPLEAPLRHSNGAHWGRFVRTIVEVEADNGLVGLGEMGGGGQSGEAAVRALRDYLVGHDPARTEALRFMLANPTASLYNNRTQLLAAIEFACLDLSGPAPRGAGARAARRQGPRPRRVRRPTCSSATRPPTAAARCAPPSSWSRTPARSRRSTASPCTSSRAASSRRTTSWSATGHWPRRSPATGCGYDPNGAWSPEESIRFAAAIEDLRNDYLEDPTWGMNGLRRVRERTGIPLATNTVVVNFEQLATNVRDPAVDVVLLDTTFWGGIRAVRQGGRRVRDVPAGRRGALVRRAGHPAGHHAAPRRRAAEPVVRGRRALPPPDRRRHRRRAVPYRDGAHRVPDAPGLGVDLDRDKVAEYAELYRELGGYPYDRDPAGPAGTRCCPTTDWADPAQAGPVDLGGR